MPNGGSRVSETWITIPDGKISAEEAARRVRAGAFVPRTREPLPAEVRDALAARERVKKALSKAPTPPFGPHIQRGPQDRKK